MWPFRRRRPALSPSVRIGELASSATDFVVPTVGQSRLAESFARLGVDAESTTHPRWALLRAVVDPRMKVVADVTVVVDGQTVGYLRPPALDDAIALLREHRTEALEVPVLITWGPTGPDVWLAPFH